MRADTLVVVLRQTGGAASALNTPADTWPEVGTVYAAMMPGSGQEGEGAAQEASIERAVFRVWGDALTRSITTRDRLRAGGFEWKITGCGAAPGARRGYLELRAMRRSDV